MTKYFVILLFSLITATCAAQNIIVKEIDESNFPNINITFTVESKENQVPNIEIVEKGEKTECEITKLPKQQDNSNGNIYVVLIENSYFFTKNNLFNELSAGLQNLIDMANDNDRINILYFGTKNPNNENISYINAEPTSAKQILKQITAKQFTPNNDSTYIDNQLFESLIEANTYAQNIEPIQNTKILFYIGRAINLGSVLEIPESFYQDIESGRVYYNILAYDGKSQNAKNELLKIAELSNGAFTTFQQGELEEKLAQMMEKTSKKSPKISIEFYTATFTTRQRGMLNTFEIKTPTSSVSASFSNPRYAGILGLHPATLFLITAAIIIAIIFLLYYSARSKVLRTINIQEIQRIRDVQKQNRILKKELDKYRRHPISIAHSFDNFNNSETLIGSGKIVPKILIECDGEQSSHELTKLVMTIGRNPDNDIVINNRTISGRHATLSYEGGFFYITDNNSTNGVFVNDIRIEKNKVHTGDIIRFGAIFAKLNY